MAIKYMSQFLDKNMKSNQEVKDLDDVWWGDAIEDISGAKDSTAKPFQIKVDDVVLKDLNDQLVDNIKRMEATANNFDSLTDTFEYGMNSRYLKVSVVLSYPYTVLL